jgi:hypothetical protein
MPDVLAPELISEIISHLDPANIQDLHALTACNLVSLTFSAASRAVLFRTICVSPDLTVHGFYERSARNDAVIVVLKSILSQSPDFSKLIRVIYLDSEAFRITADLQAGNFVFLTSFGSVQSLHIFGWDYMLAYGYVLQSLQCFPELCTLAVSNACLLKFNPATTNSRVYWQNYIQLKPDEAFKPAGIPDVPLNGTENWCLTRKLGTDGVSGKWTLSAVQFCDWSLDSFPASDPKVLWSIPHFIMSTTVGCTSLAACVHDVY